MDDPNSHLLEAGTKALTAAEHLAKADAAYKAAQEAHGRYVDAKRARLDTDRHLADYLDLTGIINIHANMATAKTFQELRASSMWPRATEELD
jgi:hypothetical protein